MTQAEKIEITKTLVDNDPEATPETLRVYLLLAEQQILDRLYPFNREKYADGVPDEYAMLHCQLASRKFLRRGSEAESNHEENGINRSYGSTDDSDILSRLTPYAVVI